MSQTRNVSSLTPYQNCAPQAPKFVFVISFFSVQISRKLCAKFSFEQIACRKTKAKIRAQQTHPIQYVLGCAHLHPCVWSAPAERDRGRGSMSSKQRNGRSSNRSLRWCACIAQHQRTLNLVRQNALLVVPKHGLNEREHSFPVFFRLLPPTRRKVRSETRNFWQPFEVLCKSSSHPNIAKFSSQVGSPQISE